MPLNASVGSLLVVKINKLFYFSFAMSILLKFICLSLVNSSLMVLFIRSAIAFSKGSPVCGMLIFSSQQSLNKPFSMAKDVAAG